MGKISRILTIGLWIITLVAVRPVTAQSGNASSELQVLATPNTFWSRPSIAADSAGKIHVFWSDRREEDPFSSGQNAKGDTLYHALWDGVGWSEPLDIFLMDVRATSIVYPLALVDQHDQIYLFWSGETALYFSRVAAADAHNAARWQSPQVLDERPGIDHIHPLIDLDGRLHLFYSVLQGELGGNVVHIQSADQGDTWSVWQLVSNVAPASELVSGSPKAVVDGQGWIHIVWTERVPPNWLGQRILYTHSQDNGETWQATLELAVLTPGERWAEVPSIASTPDGTLHVVWVCGSSPHRCYRASSDGGLNWTATQPIFGSYISRAGWDAMTADAEGNLHLFTQLREPYGMYYAFKPVDGPWRLPILVVDRPGFEDGHFPQITISQGNQLHAVWQRYDMSGDVVYQRFATEASPIVATPRDETDNRPAPTATPVAETMPAGQDPTPQAIGTPLATMQPDSLVRSSMDAVLIGVLPTLFLIGLMVIIKRRR